MKRSQKILMLVPCLILALASTANAQSTSGYQDFGIAGVLLNPDRPTDFIYLTDLLVYGYTVESSDPIPLNDINITFDPLDDESDPQSL